jgi:hypothetical protein
VGAGREGGFDEVVAVGVGHVGVVEPILMHTIHIAWSFISTASSLIEPFYQDEVHFGTAVHSAVSGAQW